MSPLRTSSFQWIEEDEEELNKSEKERENVLGFGERGRLKVATEIKQNKIIGFLRD